MKRSIVAVAMIIVFNERLALVQGSTKAIVENSFFAPIVIKISRFLRELMELFAGKGAFRRRSSRRNYISILDPRKKDVFQKLVLFLGAAEHTNAVALKDSWQVGLQPLQEPQRRARIG